MGCGKQVVSLLDITDFSFAYAGGSGVASVFREILTLCGAPDRPLCQECQEAEYEKFDRMLERFTKHTKAP